MSLIGTFRTSQPDSGMSAVGGRAEVVIASTDFRVCEDAMRRTEARRNVPVLSFVQTLQSKEIIK